MPPIEGLNSDRPGTAALMVEKDVYDSISDCLVIPKGSMITAPYSSDIQPGQERRLRTPAAYPPEVYFGRVGISAFNNTAIKEIFDSATSLTGPR